MPNSHIFPPIEGEQISDEALQLLDKIFELPIKEAKDLTVERRYLRVKVTEL
jgi:hypothetical protein